MLDFFDKTHFPASETYGDKNLMDHFALSEVVKALFFFKQVPDMIKQCSSLTLNCASEQSIYHRLKGQI